jgi:4'-phosphopantetheinyl transferase
LAAATKLSRDVTPSSDEGRLRLHQNQVDIWLAQPCRVGDDLLSRYRELMDDGELARWRRFKVDDAKLQHIVARALVRTTLSRYFDVPASAWRFTANRYGRPYIDEPEAYRHVRFNLSHTTGLVACAIIGSGDVGVDVENIRRNVGFEDLAQAVFSPFEASYFMRSAPERQRDVFFSYWTLKEAYIKARGRGLSLPLDGFWLHLDESPLRIEFADTCPDDPGRWQFRQFVPTDDHKMALAVAEVADFTINQHWVVPLAPDDRASEPASGAETGRR